VTKRHLMLVASRNLSTIMRMLCGIGSPRALQGLRGLLQTAWIHNQVRVLALKTDMSQLVIHIRVAVASLRLTWSTNR